MPEREPPCGPMMRAWRPKILQVSYISSHSTVHALDSLAVGAAEHCRPSTAFSCTKPTVYTAEMRPLEAPQRLTAAATFPTYPLLGATERGRGGGRRRPRASPLARSSRCPILHLYSSRGGSARRPLRRCRRGLVLSPRARRRLPAAPSWRRSVSCSHRRNCAPRRSTLPSSPPAAARPIVGRSAVRSPPTPCVSPP